MLTKRTADSVEHVRERIPGRHPGERKDQVGLSFARQAGNDSEDESKDQCRHERLENHPDHAEGRLLVADPKIALGQGPEQVAESQQFGDVDERTRFAGTDPHVREFAC